MSLNRPGLVVSGVLLVCIATGFSAATAAKTKVSIGVNLDVTSLFRAMDTNRNGRVSKTEYKNHANKTFNQCDTNGDGRLSEQELQGCTNTLDQNGVPVSSNAAQTASAMHSNRDGSVSQPEYDAYVDQQFRDMDTDGSGALDQGELRDGLQNTAAPPGSQPTQY